MSVARTAAIGTGVALAGAAGYVAYQTLADDDDVAKAATGGGPSAPPPQPSDQAGTAEQAPEPPAVAVPEPAPAPSPPAAAPPPVTFTNPVFQQNAPDPSVIRADDGTYYAYTTNAGYWPGVHVNTPVVKSTDLKTWTYVGDAFPDKPSWVDKDMWAPHISKTGDHFTLFYSGRDHEGKMKVGYATAQTPEGPFQDRGILINSGSWGYDIDPYLHETNGKHYLYWGSGPEGLMGQEVRIEGDGSVTRLGQAQLVLGGGADAQERQLLEGAWMTEHDGKYYLMYSAGSWQDDYVVKVARGDSPLGPFEKLGHPIMQAGSGFRAPGHHSVVKDGAGEDWMVYHAWVDGHPEWGRAMLIDKIEWKDGWPVVNGGNGPSNAPMTAPVTDAADGARAASGR